MALFEIRDNELYISHKNLARLHEKYGVEASVKFLSNLIDEYNIELPLKAPTLEEADIAHEKLLELNSRSLLKNGDVVTRYPSESFPLASRYINSSNVGNAASNHFHHRSRMFCDSINSPSPMRVWHTPKFRESMLRAVFSLKNAHVDSKVLGSCIAMRKYIASQFRPSAAKALYDKFAQGGAVLDMCSGWGDRLEGFLASSAVEYTGYDPNIHLHEGYNQQIRRYKSSDKIAKIHYSGFERAVLKQNHYDIAFTSTPYFNIERYSRDDDQSFIRYKDCDVWIKKFLLPLAQKAYDSLRVGGHLCINISDVYSNHTVNKLCDPLNNYMRKIGAKEGKHFGYRMAKRVGSKSDVAGIFVEPVWHWIKR